jgi:hypothetical protein
VTHEHAKRGCRYLLFVICYWGFKVQGSDKHTYCGFSKDQKIPTIPGLSTPKRCPVIQDCNIYRWDWPYLGLLPQVHQSSPKGHFTEGPAVAKIAYYPTMGKRRIYNTVTQRLLKRYLLEDRTCKVGNVFQMT